MKRRTFLRVVGPGATGLGLAGCLTRDEPATEGTTTGSTPADGTVTDEATPTTTPAPDLEGTLTVATYQSWVDSPSSGPGAWVKREFEKQYPDATLQYTVPENGINYYIQRRAQNAGIDADVYVGLNVDELIRVDQKLDRPLFRTADRSRMENASHVLPELEIDPKGRALPYDTGYISLVYDETATPSAPDTFEKLTQNPFAGTLLAQNAQTSDTGKAFLLWTVAHFGTDGYLEYWDRLLDNDVRILADWDASYAAYGNGERPIVVSYSTDQVYANRYDQPMSRHQVSFLNGEGYANPEAMAAFSTTDEPDLARAFMDFMLSKRAQSKIPVLNVQFPATDHADLPEAFDRYAYTPETPVTFTYDELQGEVEGWVDKWAKRVASR